MRHFRNDAAIHVAWGTEANALMPTRRTSTSPRPHDLAERRAALVSGGEQQMLARAARR